MFHQILPDREEFVSFEDVAGWYRPIGTSRWLTANMVSSVDGAMTVEGSSRKLATEGDRWLFGLLRALSDVIVVGAGTARVEDYGSPTVRGQFRPLREGRPPAATLAVVSASGDLDLRSRLFTGPARPVVITREAVPLERRRELADVADVMVHGEDTVDLESALIALADRYGPSLLTEGGPTLLGALLAERLLDAISVTTSPYLVSGTAGRIVSGPELDPVSLIPIALFGDDDGARFSLYHVRGSRMLEESSQTIRTTGPTR